MQNKNGASRPQGANRRPQASQGANRRPQASQGANRRPAANQRVSARRPQARRPKNRIVIAIIAGVVVLIVIAMVLILRPGKSSPEAAGVEAIPVPDPVEDMTSGEDDGVPPGSSPSDTEVY